MSDAPPPISQPQLSTGTIEYQRGLLTPEFEREHPAHAAMIRNSLELALKASGQDKVETDPRTAELWKRYRRLRPLLTPCRPSSRKS